MISSLGSRNTDTTYKRVPVEFRTRIISYRLIRKFALKGEWIDHKSD